MLIRFKKVERTESKKRSLARNYCCHASTVMAVQCVRPHLFTLDLS